MKRIEYLDGLRGIAILLVIFFHAFARWPEHTPYANEYAEFFLFKGGYLGVQLFFIISGFVILLSLERCATFQIFLYKRWLRLFPAMLFCSLLVYLSSEFFFERPKGQPNLVDLIPGITFIEPFVWKSVFGFDFASIEGAFWSLYVEVKFYIIAALTYFTLGGRNLVLMLTFLSSSYWILNIFYLAKTLPSVLVTVHALLFYLGSEYFLWFSAGMAFYLYAKSQHKGWLSFAVAVSLMSSIITTYGDTMAMIYALALSLLFTASVTMESIQPILKNRILVLLGFVSYPLYLIHENMMISIVQKLDPLLPFIPNIFLPFIAISMLIVVCLVITKHVEPLIKNQLQEGLKFVKVHTNLRNLRGQRR
ncbi:MAG: peptidoglycan/LPS O-acetylase OafA/YrhL [Paraglaciecola sp.]